MRIKAGLMGVVGILLALLAVGIVSVEAQRGGMGRGRGGFDRGDSEQMEKMRAQMEAVRVFQVDALWSALSFGLDLPEAQMLVLKPIMANVWSKRNMLMNIGKERGSWEEVRDELKDLKKDVDQKLKDILSKDQQKALKKLLKENAPPSARSGRF